MGREAEQMVMRLFRTSQCELLERELRRRANQFVPLPELVEASGSLALGRRIQELRARGLRIENRLERDRDGRCRSAYRLTLDEPGARAARPT